LSDASVAPTWRWRKDVEPQRGPAVKSRSQVHGAKCEKSLNGKAFCAASESFF
jgi:hypothetical protein